MSRQQGILRVTARGQPNLCVMGSMTNDLLSNKSMNLSIEFMKKLICNTSLHSMPVYNLRFHCSGAAWDHRLPAMEQISKKRPAGGQGRRNTCDGGSQRPLGLLFAVQHQHEIPSCRCYIHICGRLFFYGVKVIYKHL